MIIVYSANAQMTGRARHRAPFRPVRAIRRAVLGLFVVTATAAVLVGAAGGGFAAGVLGVAR